MNIYRQKRINKGLGISYIAEKLGITYTQYVDIEKGERKMPSRLIDKFNEIINKGNNELKIEKMDKEKEINDWFEEVTSNNCIELKRLMANFNIDSYRQLSKLLEYNNSSTISIYINNIRNAPFSFKSRLYLFFKDELNIQKKKQKVKKAKTIQPRREDLLDFYNNFDFKKWLEDNNISIKHFASQVNIPATTAYYFVNHVSNPTDRTIAIFKNAIENYKGAQDKTSNLSKKVVAQTDESFKNKLIEKYNNKIDNIEKEVVEVTEKIATLQDKLKEINEKKNIYQEIIAELEGEF